MTSDAHQSRIQAISRECVAVRLRLLNRVVTNVYDEALRPLGIKVSQLNILVAIGAMGTARSADVGEVLCLEPSTLSRNLERMRTQGWIEEVDSEDARSKPLRLTATGRKVLAQAHTRWEDAQRDVRKLLGADLTAAIGRAASSLGGVPPTRA